MGKVTVTHAHDFPQYKSICVYPNIQRYSRTCTWTWRSLKSRTRHSSLGLSTQSKLLHFLWFMRYCLPLDQNINSRPADSMKIANMNIMAIRSSVIIMMARHRHHRQPPAISHQWECYQYKSRRRRRRRRKIRQR